MDSSPHNVLMDLYAEWRHLTDLEGEAIIHDEWPTVAQQQTRKETLKSQIIQAIQAWRAEREDAGHEPAAVSAVFDREFRPIVTDLIQRETRNHDALHERRQRLENALATVNQSANRLRGVHRAYSPPPNSRWQSYS